MFTRLSLHNRLCISMEKRINFYRLILCKSKNISKGNQATKSDFVLLKMDVLYNVFRDKRQPMLFVVRLADGSHTRKTVKAVRFSRFM